MLSPGRLRRLAMPAFSISYSTLRFGFIRAGHISFAAASLPLFQLFAAIISLMLFFFDFLRHCRHAA
jgi:hypothetical protein